MRFRWFVVLGLVIAASLVATALRDHHPNRSEYCTATVDGTEAQVDLEQARWTSLMAAIAQARGLPPRAVTIAIATAFQESKIHNIDYGDRDSLGLFQQRPSQGWGTQKQVLDPYHSIGRFYDALVKVKGYTTMKITDAAQKVQRSATPGAYAQHEAAARVLASSLTGYSPAAFTCQVNTGPTGNTNDVRSDVSAAFGKQPVVAGSDRLDYPLTGSAANQRIHGWALAQYLVANAVRLGVQEVSFDGRSWSQDDSPRGWTTSSSASSDTVLVNLR